MKKLKKIVLVVVIVICFIFLCKACNKLSRGNIMYRYRGGEEISLQNSIYEFNADTLIDEIKEKIQSKSEKIFLKESNTTFSIFVTPKGEIDKFELMFKVITDKIFVDKYIIYTDNNTEGYANNKTFRVAKLEVCNENFKKYNKKNKLLLKDFLSTIENIPFDYILKELDEADFYQFDIKNYQGKYIYTSGEKFVNNFGTDCYYIDKNKNIKKIDSEKEVYLESTVVKFEICTCKGHEDGYSASIVGILLVEI